MVWRPLFYLDGIFSSAILAPRPLHVYSWWYSTWSDNPHEIAPAIAHCHLAHLKVSILFDQHKHDINDLVDHSSCYVIPTIIIRLRIIIRIIYKKIIIIITTAKPTFLNHSPPKKIQQKQPWMTTTTNRILKEPARVDDAYHPIRHPTCWHTLLSCTHAGVSVLNKKQTYRHPETRTVKIPNYGFCNPSDMD